MNNLILLLLSAYIFTSYNAFIIAYYGAQKSVSATYYKLPGLWKSVFTFVLCGFSIPLLFIGESGFLKIAVGILVITSSAPAYNKHKLEEVVHIFSASLSILFGMLSLIIDHNLWPLVVICAGICGLIYILHIQVEKAKKIRTHYSAVLNYSEKQLRFIKNVNPVLWMEKACFYTIVFGLLIAEIY